MPPRRYGRIGISVTSYENGRPIITHTFWGDTLDQAQDYATSHLVSDYFFSSTISPEGEMMWKGNIIQLDYEGHVTGTAADEDELFLQLTYTADGVHEDQIRSGIAEKINELSLKLDVMY